MQDQLGSVRDKAPDRDYLYCIYAGLAGVAGGLIEYWEGQSDRGLFYVGCFGLLIGIYRFAINKLNEHTSSPIPDWLSQLWLAAAVFLVGIVDYLVAGASYGFILFLSAVAAVISGFYYLRGKSRVS
jgi:hypothetical protein